MFSSSRDVADLLGRQAVDREREARLHPAEQILVPADRQLRVEAALQQDLHAAQVDGLLELLRELLARQHVALGLVGGRPVEVAELAAGHADVRVVDVAIDDVGDLAVGVQRLAARVGGGAELERRRVGVQAERVVGRQALAGGGVGQQGVDGSRRGAGRRGRDARRGLRTAGGEPVATAGRRRARDRRTPTGRTAPPRPAGSGCRAGGSARSPPDRRGAPRTRRARSSGARRGPGRRLSLQQRDVVGPDRAGAAGQHGVDERQPGEIPPGRAEVDDVRKPRRGGEAGVADHERARACPTPRPAPRRAAPRGSAASGRAPCTAGAAASPSCATRRRARSPSSPATAPRPRAARCAPGRSRRWRCRARCAARPRPPRSWRSGSGPGRRRRVRAAPRSATAARTTARSGRRPGRARGRR